MVLDHYYIGRLGCLDYTAVRPPERFDATRAKESISHQPLFNWHHTFETCTLSLAVPFTVNTALLQRWFWVGEVMVIVGFVAS
jgi:hypothetical protein